MTDRDLKRRISLLAGAAILAAGLAPGAASAADVAVAPFYARVAAASPADRPLGTVVAREPVDTAIAGAKAWRIAYVSSDAMERQTVSTALVIAPDGPPPAAGRPIAVWAHGTTGTAQNCGPSQPENPAQDLNQYNLIGGTSWTDFGVPAATEFIRRGYALIATDYQGLGGGGGAHQYAAAATQGRDIVNAARAIGAMGLAGRGRQAIAYGWSQGGGAVLAAAHLGRYIGARGTAHDGIAFVGFVALAPQEIEVLVPSDARGSAAGGAKFIGKLAGMFSGTVFDFTHFAMALWGTQAAFPELKLTDMFTDDGAAAVDAVFSQKCMHPGADTLAFNFGAGYTALLRPDPRNAPGWVGRLVDGSVSPDPAVAPVIIYYGNKDVTNPPVMGELYQQRRCAAGANITRVQLPGEQNHFTTPGASQPLYVAWMADRFAGKPLPSGCPAS